MVRGGRTLRDGRTATTCGEEPPLVQPNPHPRTGEVKPPYRAERLPQQGRTLIRPGKGSCSFSGGQNPNAEHILQYVTGRGGRGAKFKKI